MGAPTQSSVTISRRKVLARNNGLVQGASVLLDSAVVDSGSSPRTTIIREGNVLGKDSSGNAVLSTDSTVVASAAAAITTSGHVDTLAAIVVVGNHGTISVTTTTGTGTEAENATDLNADDAFAAHYIASSGGGELTITSRGVGAAEGFYIDATTDDGFGFAEGPANGQQGTDGEYCVLAEPVDMLNGDTLVAQDTPGKCWSSGQFLSAGLLNMSPDAQTILSRRGSTFE